MTQKKLPILEETWLVNVHYCRWTKLKCIIKRLVTHWLYIIFLIYYARKVVVMNELIDLDSTLVYNNDEEEECIVDIVKYYRQC